MAPGVVADLADRPGCARGLRPEGQPAADVEERGPRACPSQDADKLRRIRARSVVEGQREASAARRRTIDGTRGLGESCDGRQLCRSRDSW